MVAVDKVGASVFLLFPQVPLEEEASQGCLSIGGLDLVVADGGTGPSIRRRSALKNYATNRRKASL